MRQRFRDWPLEQQVVSVAATSAFVTWTLLVVGTAL